MVDFTVTINNKAHLAGLEAAKDEYNNGLSKTPVPNTDPVEYKPVEDHPDYLATAQDYVQHVMSRACESYAKSYGYTTEAALTLQKQEIEAKIAKLKAL